MPSSELKSLPSPQVRPLRLFNQIQNYSWGTRNNEAFIPALLGQKAEPGLPYAELWMGSHTAAPSRVLAEDGQLQTLGDLISRNPEAMLGIRAARKFKNQLPFLFKVLSVGEPLSIQAHPDKSHARILHKKDPEHYPDDNHKPEIAIALDKLEALIGFRSFNKIEEVLIKTPEIDKFIGKGSFGSPSDLKSLIGRLVSRAGREPRLLLRSIESLEKRLLTLETLTGHERLFLDLRKTYTDSDIGLFLLFFLNFVSLEKGEGVYLAAGIPHLYLKGNIIECMANSDNVVRAGLTDKFKDSQTLAEILDYNHPPVTKVETETIDSLTSYITPTEEFLVQHLFLNEDQSLDISGNTTAMLVLVTEGSVLLQWTLKRSCSCSTFQKGWSFFIPAGMSSFSMKSKSSSNLYFIKIPE